MMTLDKKYHRTFSIIYAVLAVGFFFVSALPAMADPPAPAASTATPAANITLLPNIAEIKSLTGLNDTPPVVIVGTLIQAVLFLLGIVALVLIIYGGVLWMTAHGNEEQVGTARSILIAAVIGLAIILASYGIAFYIFSVLQTATGYNYSGPAVE